MCVCVFNTTDNAGEMVLFEEKTGKKKKAQAVREEVDDGLEEDMEVKEEGEGEGEGSRDEPVLVRVEEETDKHKLASQQTSRGKSRCVIY